MALSTISPSSKEAVLTMHPSMTTQVGSIGNTVHSSAMEYTLHTPMIMDSTIQLPQETNTDLLLRIFVTLLTMIFQGTSKVFASLTLLKLSVMQALEKTIRSYLRYYVILMQQDSLLMKTSLQHTLTANILWRPITRLDALSSASKLQQVRKNMMRKLMQCKLKRSNIN